MKRIILLASLLFATGFACSGIGVFIYVISSYPKLPLSSPTTLAVPTITPPLSILELVSTSGIANESAFVVDGLVKNISPDKDCLFVKVLVEYYDNAGHFITSDFEYITIIEAGKSAPFKIMTLRHSYPIFETYKTKISSELGCD